MLPYTSWLKNSIWCLAFMLFGVQASPQLRINEILAINSSHAHDTDFGEFADFVELYNGSDHTVKLKGFTISDNPNNVSKWQFPDHTLQPGQYLLLWADGMNKVPGDTAFCNYRNTIVNVKEMHLNFKLSGDGEYLGIFDSEKKLIDEVYFGVQQTDITFGRNESNPTEWNFFGDPTPGSRNSNFGAQKPIFAATTVFSKPGGFYNGTQTITLAAPSANAEIRYTIDGSDPDHQSALFTEPIEVFRNLTIKARVYENAKLPGPVSTHTYFIGEDIGLPVISVSTTSDHLWDFSFGLFRNAIKEREVPAVIEYFDENGQKGFTEGVGLRLFGTTIYNLPQKPMSIRFRSKFGESELNFPLFKNRENLRYKSFLLRNGGNDHNLAFFRDGLAVSLIKGQMDLDYQDYQPCVVFLNGEYQGIYNIRERLDNHYIANNHNLSNNNLDVLEDSLIVASGSADNYHEMLRFIESSDISKEENYEQLASLIDINEFINYMIHKTFVGYRLFDINNKYWRESNENGKWRWVTADMEHGFGQLSGDNYWENTIEKATGMGNELPVWSTLLFSKLLSNQHFKDEFIQRYAYFLNTVYQPERTLAITDSLNNMIAGQMPRHINKWKTPVNMPVWEGNVEFIREFLRQRPAHVRTHISSLFGLPDSALVTINWEGKGGIVLSG
jgi:hypothetical protein